MRLDELIRVRTGVTGAITANALTAAIDKRQEETQKAAVESLVGLVDSFVGEAEAREEIAQDAEKIAASERAAANATVRALRYFEETMNPLPFFAATSNHCDGERWCRNNKVAVPARTSDAWKVPAEWEPTVTA